jgi:hypothetical protein
MKMPLRSSLCGFCEERHGQTPQSLQLPPLQPTGDAECGDCQRLGRLLPWGRARRHSSHAVAGAMLLSPCQCPLVCVRRLLLQLSPGQCVSI